MHLCALAVNIFTVTILGVNSANLDEVKSNDLDVFRKVKSPSAQVESMEEEDDHNWDSDSFGLVSPDQRGERRRKKQERRKDRQERRKERRRNRHRLHNIAKDEIIFPVGHQQSFPESRNFKRINFGRSEPLPNNNVKVPAASPSGTGWLESNITSIWFTLQHIQRDIKQLRRQLRANSGEGRGSKKAVDSRSEVSTSEPCDPRWDGEPNGCIDEQGVVCGGKGQCLCGQCSCEAPYYGIHCRCNDMICERSGGVLCGGAGRGQCRCGACVCRPEFTGRSCDCSISISECRKGNGEICSGKGNCACNRCQCQDGYTGKYCDESIYSAIICERLKPCVLCLAYGKKYPQCEDCNIKVQIVEELESSRATCLMVHLGCILKYAYVTQEEEGEDMTVFVKKDRSCP